MARKDIPMNDSISEILQRLSRMDDAIRKIEHTYLNTEFLRRHISAYIGSNTAVTYLEDETPIYVNSNDFGPPANFINGGVYERENLTVLMSFVRDDTVFLDVGANLGFFSLKVAQRNKAHGKVHAFEPHPSLVRLARASAYLNGYGQLGQDDGVIVVHQCGLGNENVETVLTYPADHLGGGAVGGHSVGSTQVVTQVHRLDDLFGPDFTFDLAKIDVEGFEVEVLMGMLGSIARSANPVLLFEKLGLHRGYESDIERTLGGAGLHLFGISADSVLYPIATGGLAGYDGYVVAAREPNIELNRNFFRIYPTQLMTSGGVIQKRTNSELEVVGNSGDIIFHGPYWYLSRGVYRLTLEGTITGVIELSFAHHFGYPETSIILRSDCLSADFLIKNDLPKFELICRPKSTEAKLSLLNIHIQRLG